MDSWAIRGGVSIPVAGSVAWKLEGKPFDYFRRQILEVAVNPKGTP